MPDNYLKDLNTFLMEDDPATKSKKRTLEYMNAKEMDYKFKSKLDIYVYLDEHSKLQHFLSLIPL